MPPEAPHEGALIAFTPPAHPVLGPWREALMRRMPVHGVWGFGGTDLARRFLGLTEREAHPPLCLPAAPWGGPWRPAHGAWIRRHWPRARTVVFTRPDQAALLGSFADCQAVYYAIDDYETYGRPWGELERGLLRRADRVVCVSAALARRLEAREPSALGKVTVLPNAVPADWVPAEAPLAPVAPGSGRALARPVAGVLGRVSSRLRLDWLLQAVEALPWLHWLFAGDIEWPEVVPADRPRIEALRGHPRCRFLGRQPFARMRAHAASLDVAVLPYSGRSTNPCGSPVRLFVHMPWSAPILATPGCAQVEEFEPLLTLCASPDSLVARLTELRASGFDDGRRLRRWEEASRHTWDERAGQWAALLGRR